MKNISAADIIKDHERHGYESIATDSGTGSTILVNKDTDRVVKINYDDAYDVFADYAKTNPSTHLVKIYSHKLRVFCQNGFSTRFSVTEMEFLNPLSQEEQRKVIAWIDSIYQALRKGHLLSSISDDLGLNDVFQDLLELARKTDVNLDMGNSSNYMVRHNTNIGTYVITDPFN